MKAIQTSCCIAGGGPAGMMLGYLLARAGIDVTVLEKHPDFFRDFRGDTIHPSTMEVMHELGLLKDFLKVPHQKIHRMTGNISGREFTFADLSGLPVHCPYIAMMPQWDFLNFIASQAKAYPNFHLLMDSNAADLLEENGAVTGIKATTPQGETTIHTPLTIAADGRHSTLRKKSGLPLLDIGAPIDVLWMRISRLPSDPETPQGRFDRGQLFVMIYRGDYWQCAYVIPKGSLEQVQQNGLEAFRASIAKAAPFLGERANEIQSWEQVKLLTVAVNRLKQWAKPGLICIGDAAHAMSPVGGVGINLAVQDAVAAANILIPAYRENRLSFATLQQVQKRRERPTRLTQALQVAVQNRVLNPVIRGKGPLKPPSLLLWLLRKGWIQWLPARLIGTGFKPEHIKKDLFAI